MMDKALVVFEGKNVRRTWFNDEWWFVVIDIIAILTNSSDPSGYLKDMRRRDEGFAQGWGQIATPPLPVETGEKVVSANNFLHEQKKRRLK